MRKKYTVNHKRPVNLALGSMKYPPMAIASILHRISGLVLFLLLPIMLYFLSLSLRSAESFAHLQTLLMSPYCKLLLWGFSAAFIYHVIAGIRHMLMDMGYGEELGSGRVGAIIVIVLAVISAVILGVWIWSPM
jgi:succinate dehydrogenase / fumarate reductase cytochrome b subunit